MFKTATRPILVLPALMIGLAWVAGCDRSSSSPSSRTPGAAEVPIVAGPDEPAAVEADRDPRAACCDKTAVGGEGPGMTPAAPVEVSSSDFAAADPDLLDQDGHRVRFRRDLVAGNIVAVNFVFTSCKGICPPLGANFARLQERLGSRVGNGVRLISVSVDPQVDTPERLLAWRKGFRGGPGWTLLTGDKQDVDLLLKDLGVFAADKTNHSPFILVGDGRAGRWTRVHGLTAPEKLAEMIAGLQDTAGTGARRTPGPPPQVHPGGDANRSEAKAAPASPAENYFTNVELVNHRGERRKLYTDVLKGRIVVIHSFFASCKGSCPVLLSGFARIQEHFADRVGKDLSLISITVDPLNDTPQVLAALAEQWKAGPGWQFLTGDKASVDAALHKLGQRVDNRESHSNVFIIGNEATGLWKKARGLSRPEDLFPLIDEVLKDKL
jgi:cytochrome oxidase Cu insertion factor (SCO1/SenC/PrrC family)